jgi:hypothetical protein
VVMPGDVSPRETSRKAKKNGPEGPFFQSGDTQNV